MKSDIEIAREAELLPITDIAGRIGVPQESLVPYGHDKAKSRRFGSVEEEALETFAIKKKAEKMEEELRNFIIGNYGLNGWNEIIRIQAQIRKERLAEKKRREEELQQIIEWGTIGSLVFLIVVFLFWILWVAVNA